MVSLDLFEIRSRPVGPLSRGLEKDRIMLKSFYSLLGLWAIPSTEPGPQPLLVTYDLSSLALTPGGPTPLGVYVRGYAIRTRVV